MSTKKPWFPLYASDFVTDTQAMSYQAVGAYMRLLLYQWINGSVPRPPSQMRRIIGCTQPEWESLWAELEMKFEGDQFKVRNPRLERERAHADKLSRIRRKTGQKGAEKRWEPPPQAPVLKGGNSKSDPLATALSAVSHPFDTAQSQSQEEKDPPAPSAPTPPRGRRRVQLPEDWEPDDKLLDWQRGKFPKVNAREETEKFKTHAKATGRTMKDWRAAWRMWIQRSIEDFGGRGGQRLSTRQRIEKATGVPGL